jgi:hypothetical protein
MDSIVHEHNNTYIGRTLTPKYARVWLVLEGKKTEIIVKNSLLFPKREGVGVFSFSFCCTPVFLSGPELEITMCL